MAASPLAVPGPQMRATSELDKGVGGPLANVLFNAFNVPRGRLLVLLLECGRGMGVGAGGP